MPAGLGAVFSGRRWSEGRVKDLGHQRDLVVEIFLGYRLQLLLAYPSGPLGLTDGPRADQVSAAGIVDLVADFPDGGRLGTEGDAVVGFGGCDAPHHGGEVFRGDVGADRVGVDALGGPAGVVDGQEDAALEDEVLRVLGAAEPVEERLKQVPGEELLGWGVLAGPVAG